MSARTAGGAINDNAPTLSETERSRLAAILGRLGSDFEGERDTAARMATRFVRERGLGWRDVLAPVTLLEAPRREADLNDWRATAMALARLDVGWTDFERRFLASLPAFRSLSPKQHDLLNELVERAQWCGA